MYLLIPRIEGTNIPKTFFKGVAAPCGVRNFHDLAEFANFLSIDLNIS
tara:strand:- start:70 stop:213 length:144 start_codon:yes stop_codon:yes gene_type:complete